MPGHIILNQTGTDRRGGDRTVKRTGKDRRTRQYRGRRHWTGGARKRLDGQNRSDDGAVDERAGEDGRT